jgi:hypothetical protein
LTVVDEQADSPVSETEPVFTMTKMQAGQITGKRRLEIIEMPISLRVTCDIVKKSKSERPQVRDDS